MSRSGFYFSALVLLCALLFYLSRPASPLGGSSSRVSSEKIPRSMTQRRMVGGYSSAKISDEDVTTVAMFALDKHVEGESPESYSSFAVLPGEVGDTVHMTVLKAQKQVVAGLNYKMTIALVKEGTCLGAFNVTVWNHFGDLKVTNWGHIVPCSEANALMETQRENEEVNPNE